MILRQVIAMQMQLDRQPHAANWNATAQRVRTYYEQKGINSLLLDLDRNIYTRSSSIDNAVRLGESLLANDKIDEAVNLLSTLPTNSLLVQAVLGLALLKYGNEDSARQLAGILSGERGTPMMTHPIRLRLARLEAGLGEKERAIATLTTLFAQLPPSHQIVVRKFCKKAPEFAELQSDVAFIAALQTVSRVPESACSGGSSCGTCPVRAQCPGTR
jgi:hypothetical protein